MKTRPLRDDAGLGDDPLLETLYAQPATTKRRKRTKDRKPLPEGQTYRLVTFSFYEADVARLDELLASARKKGHRKVSRSQIVRLALRQVKLDELPEMI